MSCKESSEGSARDVIPGLGLGKDEGEVLVWKVKLGGIAVASFCLRA